MSKPEISLDEHLNVLRRSALTTVVTEGSDDYKYYRRIESALSSQGVSLYPVGGRQRVLEIFERRKELDRNNVVFLVDRDLWVFGAVPHEFQHRKIVFTDGYSIENDLYCDGDLEDLLHHGELQQYHSELDPIIQWYSFAAARLLRNEPSSISEHPNQILHTGGALNATYMNEIGFSGPDPILYGMISQDYARLLRGKNLLALLVKHLSAPHRSVKFGRNHVMEMAAARNGQKFQRISRDLSAIINTFC
jgi:hypothetical protein